MFGLLLLSLAISPAAASSEPPTLPVVPEAPQVVPSPPKVKIELSKPLIVVEKRADSFDPMAFHPDPDTCYRIDFFQFSTGQNSKFLREMTCGPSEKKKPVFEKPRFRPLKPPAQ